MYRNRQNISPVPIILKSSTNQAHLFDNNDNIELSAYQYASSEIQKQLPLPSQSIKIPYRQHPGRFVNVNQRNRELDYLRGKIDAKIELQQLHYQAQLQKMKQQNFLHRQKLEQLLIASSTDPNLRDQYRIYGLNRPRFISTNNPNTQTVNQQNMTKAGQTSNSNQSVKFGDKVLTKQQKIEELLKQKEKILDEIDRIKIEGTQPVKLTRRIEAASDDSSSESSDNNEKKKNRADQRKSQMDYIYQRGPALKAGQNPHFQKKLLKEQVLQSNQKRSEYDWVKRVRKAKKHNFAMEKIESSEDSSSVSKSQKSKKIDFILDRSQTPSEKQGRAPQTQRLQQKNNINSTRRNSIPEQQQYVTKGTRNNNPIGQSTKNVLETYRGPTNRERYRTKNQPIPEEQSINQQSHLSKPARVGGYSRKIHYINPKLAKQQLERGQSYMQMYEGDRNRKSRYSYQSSYYDDNSSVNRKRY